MPITSITIENFKGVADRVTVPLRPITLLFGANSAGKSTILQALLYLRELLERKNPDADVLAGCGNAINLGGFRELVHGHDLTSKVTIGATMRVDDDGLPEYVVADDKSSDFPRAYGALSEAVESLSIFIDIEHHPMVGPWISAYHVHLNGLHVGSICGDPGKPTIIKIPDKGALYEELFNEGSNLPPEDEMAKPVHSEINDEAVEDAEESEELTTTDASDSLVEEVLCHKISFDGLNVIPDLGKPIGLYNSAVIEDKSHDPLNDHSIDFISYTDRSNAQLRELFSQVFVGAADLMLSELSRLRYIGPIREIPSRSFQPMRSTQLNRWADGSAAWDTLYSATAKPDWLKEEHWDALGLGYQLEFLELLRVDTSSKLGKALERVRLGFTGSLQELHSLPAEEFAALYVQKCFRLISEDKGLAVSPNDIGVGVSQALPVVIGAMLPGYSILAVEQPELHVHPAVQCRLADLLANQVLPARERILLLETHSEHLILRLLRRIRERQEGKLPEGAPPLEPQDLCVLYAENADGTLKLTELPVTEDGDFARDWPKGFFEERFDEYPD